MESWREYFPFVLYSYLATMKFRIIWSLFEIQKGRVFVLDFQKWSNSRISQACLHVLTAKHVCFPFSVIQC